MTLEQEYNSPDIKPNKWAEMSIHDKARILLVLLAFCEKNIVRYALLAFSMIPVIGFLSELVLPVLYGVLIALCIRRSTKIGLTELVVFTFTVSAIFFSCVLYPDNAKFILNESNFWNFIFPCLRWFIVGLAIVPDKKMMDILGLASCFAILIETAFLLFYMIPNDLIVSDDMSRSYQLLPNIMIFINYTFDKKKVWAWIVSGISVIYMLSLGTRGPVFVLLGYLILRLLMITASTLKSKIALISCVGVLGALFSIPSVYIKILTWLEKMLSGLGVSTRIIDHMIEGTVISETSGRDELYATGLEMLAENPWGYGVYGEWPRVHWNIHNMYLEILIHFGVILGSALLLWMLFFVGNAFLKTKNYDAKNLILLFGSFVFVRGFFGGTYLHYSTYFLVALCIKEIRRARKEN